MGERKMRCYISGKITANPTWREEFEAAEETVAGMGYEAVSPRKIADALDRVSGRAPGTGQYAEYMAADIRALADCDVIAFLPNHAESQGSRLERAIAQALGMNEEFL